MWMQPCIQTEVTPLCNVFVHVSALIWHGGSLYSGQQTPTPSVWAPVNFYCFFATKQSLVSELASQHDIQCRTENQICTSPELSNHCAQSGVIISLTHTHTGIILFRKVQLWLSPTESSFSSSVVLLLNPVCVSVYLLCQCWVIRGNVSLVSLTWETKRAFFNFQNGISLYCNMQHWSDLQIAKYITLSIWYLLTVSWKYDIL